MADNNNTNTTNKDTLELNDEQLEQVNGGNLAPDNYHEDYRGYSAEYFGGFQLGDHVKKDYLYGNYGPYYGTVVGFNTEDYDTLKVSGTIFYVFVNFTGYGTNHYYPSELTKVN